EDDLTVNPGVILGGTSITFDGDESRGTAFGKSNVVAEHATVAGDLRSISIAQRERAKETMRRIVGEHLPHTTAEITFDDGYPPLAPAEGNRRLLLLYDRASRDDHLEFCRTARYPSGSSNEIPSRSQYGFDDGTAR